MLTTVFERAAIGGGSLLTFISRDGYTQMDSMAAIQTVSDAHAASLIDELRKLIKSQRMNH